MHTAHHLCTPADPAAVAELLAAALDTAAHGWPVFPLAPGTKRPALHGLTRCPRTGSCTAGHLGWEQRATTDPHVIRAAWSRQPFNIGIPTGPAGLVVIDLDMPDVDATPPAQWARFDIGDGADVLSELARIANRVVPATRTVTTPSGGTHLYFRAPAGVELRNTAGEAGNGLGWLIDTRAHGGYVVAPGSRTPHGRYLLTDDRDPAELPTWLLQRLQPAPLPTAPTAPARTGRGRAAAYLEAALRAETARVIDAPAGQRNARLYVAAVALGQLVAGGALPDDQARAALRDAAARHVAIRAYSAYQAEQTITSGLRAGARRPRSIGDAA